MTKICPQLTIFDGQDEKVLLPSATRENVGSIWTKKEILATMHIDTEFYPRRERLEPMYIGQKRKIKLPKWICKKCYYAWPARQEDPPEKCANYKGYIDEEDGVAHEKCGSRHWDEWEQNFDPKTCKYTRILKVWYEEEEERRLAKAS